MNTIILTSGFPNGFTEDFNVVLLKNIDKKECFVLIASDFDNNHDKTDKYFRNGCNYLVTVALTSAIHMLSIAE